jgi:hypothetical protein
MMHELENRFKKNIGIEKSDQSNVIKSMGEAQASPLAKLRQAMVARMRMDKDAVSVRVVIVRVPCWHNVLHACMYEFM